MRERHCSEWSTAHSRPTLVVTTSPPSAHPNCSKSFLHSGARRTCRNSGTGGGTGTAACGCNTGRSDSNATAIVFKCVRCQFAAACFVQRTAAHIQCPWWTPWNCGLLYPAWRGPYSPRTLASSPGCCIEQTEHVQITGGKVSHIAHWPLRPCYLQGVVEMAHGLRLVGRSWNVRLATSVLAPGPDGGLDPHHVSCSTMRPLSSFSRCLCSPCSSTWRSLTHIGGRGISVSLSTAVTVIDHTCHRECSHSSDATFHETRIGSSAAVAPGGARLLLPQWASVRFHLPPFSVCLLGHFERFAHYTPCLPLRSGRWCAKSLPCKSPAISLQVVPVCSTEETPAPHDQVPCKLTLLALCHPCTNLQLSEHRGSSTCRLRKHIRLRFEQSKTGPDSTRVPKGCQNTLPLCLPCLLSPSLTL